MSEGHLEKAISREPSQDGVLKMARVRWPKVGDGAGDDTGDGGLKAVWHGRWHR